ncbi:metacaspase-1-like [Tripterygium wilfordii]|uniref:Metacaspase-1-like n=1 Tax=Tripterygium wilfordii TaxID=458696 RepID=A0A7J7CCT0_TRIWF|nr:metacaspase-1-like [Tripterygium wilfordii]KAF5731933.1 metacaspase-1-like [Tripterygium wilfordii]
MFNKYPTKCNNTELQRHEIPNSSSSLSSTNQQPRRSTTKSSSSSGNNQECRRAEFKSKGSSSSSDSVQLTDHQQTPRKRALLCGVSYRERKFKLKGTINDVNNIKSLLTETFHFPSENIRVLTEQEKNKDKSPTKKNIQKYLKWLVADCQKGDSLVFYFSGHGLRQPDFNQDEQDGFDETICPVDFMEEGMILDNEINSTIVQPLSEGVTLHAIIDACHSGTMLDLIHIYDREKKRWTDNRPPNQSIWKGTKGGLAISISACEDHEFAADTAALSAGATMNGVMTFFLVQIVKEHRGLTYEALLDLINKRIEQANLEGCALAKLIRKLFRGNRIIQRPQLSASERFDVTQKHFDL